MKVAIVISGLLRLAKKNTKFLKKIAEEHDVFVCTSVKDKRYIHYLGNVKDVFFVEYDPYLNNLQNNLLSVPEGSKLLQWQKLSKGFSLIEAYEKKTGIKYDSVYKIRTDLIFNDSFYINDIAPETKPKVLYMNSDIYFGGSRDTMQVASNFFIKALTNYYNRFHFNQFNLDLLRLCDVEAGKFEWLNFPAELAQGVDSFELFWEKVTANSANFKSQYSEKVINFRENYKSILFPSEPAFLNYILSENIIVRKMHPTPFRIDENRKFDPYDAKKIEILKAFLKNCKYQKMIDFYQEEDAFPNETADFFRDGALKVFNENSRLGLELITIANNIRPHGPYIERLKFEFEKIINSTGV